MTAEDTGSRSRLPRSIRVEASLGEEAGLIDRKQVSENKHDVQSEGSKPRDHDHPRHEFWRHAHKDWRLWAAVVLMLALVLVYVITNNLFLRPGNRADQPTPTTAVP
jgi:hypothetical protein